MNGTFNLRGAIVRATQLPKLALDCDRGLLDLGEERERLAETLAHLEKFHLLHPYHQAGAHFLRHSKRAIIADDMGLGKTPQTLCAINAEQCGAVIVCPASLVSHWERELSIWRPDIRQCENRFPPPGRARISSYTALDDSLARPKQPLCAIVDAAHMIKKVRSKRTRRTRNLLRRAEYGWALTGTRVLDTPVELWGILQALGLGGTLYGNFGRFARRFGGWQNTLGSTFWNPKNVRPGAQDPVRPYLMQHKTGSSESSIEDTIRWIDAHA